ncbi:MAG: GNAT family N-acetyltransferase [Candidatus Cloacimonetes bacterium]|nr:GNAT family N-acetyltransferase [Candidatus Cloacimonadota bacterium]
MIQLRRYKPTDFKQFSNLVSDPLVMDKVDGILSKAIIEDLFASFHSNNDCLVWALETKTTKQYVGHVALLEVENNPLSKELLFYIVKDKWNKGYGTLAAKLTIELAIKNRLCNKIIATVDANHKYSRKILESLGMQIEYWDQEDKQRYPVYSISV